MLLKSPIKWVGGKARLVNKLLPLIPHHKGYVEVFGGAGWLLFAKKPVKWEILNDLDSNLMNLWNVIKNYPNEFIKSFEYVLISRDLFNTYKEKYKNNDYKNEIEQAHILYYLLKAGVGASLPDGGGCGFGAAKDKSRLRINQIPDDINNAYERLKAVIIECADFRRIFKTYDSEDTFFYIDPPYRNTARSSYSVGNFTDEDYIDLGNICKQLKGKFLLTINNDNFIRELFKDFKIINHEVYYGICKTDNGRSHFKELIITNYNIQEIINLK